MISKDEIIVVTRVTGQTDGKIRYKRHPSFTHQILEIPTVQWMQNLHAQNSFEKENKIVAAFDRLDAFLNGKHRRGEFAEQWKSFNASTKKVCVHLVVDASKIQANYSSFQKSRFTADKSQSPRNVNALMMMPPQI